MKKAYKNAHEWLGDAAEEDVVPIHELMLLINEHVDADAIQDHFEGDLQQVHYFDTEVNVIWLCLGKDVNTKRNQTVSFTWVPSEPDCCMTVFVTTCWRDDIEGTGWNEDGFPIISCPVCGATMDEDNISLIQEIRSETK